MTFYGGGTFYGSGAFYGAASAVPQDLSFYRTSTDSVYVFHWGFYPAFISPSLFTYDFELQLDTVPTFDSINLVSFTTTTALSYQNGNVRKGLAVPVAPRIEMVPQVWYAQVRTVATTFTSDWSLPLTWTIPQRWQQQVAENLMTSLADYHVYGKSDLLKPVDQRDTNLYLIDNTYGNAFDAAYLENFLTQTDNYIDLCRDEFLDVNFGVLFEFPKPTNLQFVDYRWILKQLILASLVGGTNEAITRVIQAFTGVPPLLLPVRDENDFFLITIQDDPITAVAGQTVFNTSQPYIDATIVVENITTGLIVPNGSYTTDGPRGIWTMNSAPGAGVILQATFDVGSPVDIFPVVFDGTDYTALSGTFTFTNGSKNVTGVGTLFTTELAIGKQITDSNGVYLGTINQITDNTHLQLLQLWAGPTESVSAFKLVYTDIQLPPPVSFDKATLAFGIIIVVFNPGQFSLNHALIEMLSHGVLPAFIKVFFQYE